MKINLNKSQSTHLQKTTSNEGAGTKIIIWQYHPLPLLILPCLSRTGWTPRRLEQSSFTSQPAAGDSWRLMLPAGSSSPRASSFAQHKSQLGIPPHLTLNKHPLHYPSFAQDRKKKVRYIQASLGITLPGPRGTNFHSRSTPAGEARRPQAARETQPFPSPPQGRHMHAGGTSPLEHLSSTALLLQKRGGRLGAGSSRWWAKGKSRVQRLLSPVPAAVCR